MKISFIDNSDTIIRVNNTYNNQQYAFNIDKEVYSISVDPDNWIINQSGSFVKDISFETVTTGIIQQNLISTLSIYPIPNHNEFTLKNAYNEAGLLRILNNLGQQVFIKNVQAGVNQINHNLIPGVYFVNVEFADEIYQEKLIVE